MSTTVPSYTVGMEEIDKNHVAFLLHKVAFAVRKILIETQSFGSGSKSQEQWSALWNLYSDWSQAEGPWSMRKPIIIGLGFSMLGHSHLAQLPHRLRADACETFDLPYHELAEYLLLRI